MDTPRIPVLEPSAIDGDVARLVALAAQPGREPPATIAVLAYVPDLLGPFLGWAAALALRGRLTKRDHELVALRAAWRCGSGYEWIEHVEFARRANIDDDAIRASGAELALGGWDERDRALLGAVDELVATYDLSDNAWRALADHFDAAEIVEILFVTGQYTMLSIVANAARVTVPPGEMPLPDRT